MIERLPRWSLYAFIALLPLHNLVMAELWDLGVRDFALDVVSAWKEVLLALALGAIVWRQRGIPFKATPTDYLALVYAGFVLLYALIPQDWLGGDASARGVLYGLRHDLTPVAAYFLGRGLTLARGAPAADRADDPRRGVRSSPPGGSSTSTRSRSRPGATRASPAGSASSSASTTAGSRTCPENWVYNPGDEHPLRRLVSTFLSPLATRVHAPRRDPARRHVAEDAVAARG